MERMESAYEHVDMIMVQLYWYQYRLMKKKK